MSEIEENTGAVQKNKDPVDRSRRFKYISWVTAFCLVSALVVSFVAGIMLIPAGAGAAAYVTSPILDLYVRGVLGIASATVIAYVSGSVIDYNGGIGNLFTTKTKE